MYKKTRTLSAPVSPEIAAFAVVMEARLVLEEFDQADSWDGVPIGSLMRSLEMKAKRLASVDPENPTELLNRAAIIGNLAMMIAEKSSRVRQALLGSPTVQEEGCVAESTSSTGGTSCAESPHLACTPQTNSAV